MSYMTYLNKQQKMIEKGINNIDDDELLTDEEDEDDNSSKNS